MKIPIGTTTSERVEILGENQSIPTILTELACSSPKDEPVFVLDIDDLVAKFKNWHVQMPKVRPFYAVKCNDNYHVLQTLATLGTGFDCASEGEMQKVLALGVEPSRIINAQPTKMISHLKFAAQNGVATMTFDCETELYKIKEHFPTARSVKRTSRNC
jgi:ornithine decarboxylase